MKNLAVVISDVHVCLKNLEVSKKVLTQALDKARELNIPFFSAGDLRDTKSVIRAEEIIMLNNLFNEYSDIDCYLLVGNHDLTNKNSESHSLEFLRKFPNITLIDKSTSIPAFPNFKVIPYQKNNESFLEEVNIAKKEGFTRLLGHQGVHGSYMGHYVVDESSVAPSCFNSFDFVGLGHYHKYQKFDTHMYWGSPYTVSFGEAGDSKFIWVISEFEGKIHTQPIATQVRKHIQLIWEPDVEEKLAENIREDDLIKIIMKGPKEFALSKPKLDHLPTKNITLVPDIQRQSDIRIDQEIVNKPKEIIESYLESAKTELDKGHLKKFLFSLIGDTLNGMASKVNNEFKVVEAKAYNFLSYESLEYNYESKGLTLIEGHDEDHDISTGAGKSSFLDVVCYGLFGKTSKDLKADEVVNRKVGKDCEVHLALQGPNGIVTVSRYRNHKTFGNDVFYNIGDETHRGKDNRETQKDIEFLIGMDFDMFLRASYFTQFGAIDKFLSSSDTEKKKVIAEICDTKFCDIIIDTIKEENKKLDSDFSRLIGEIEKGKSRRDTLNESIQSTESSVTSWEENKKIKIDNLAREKDSWHTNHATKVNEARNMSESFESSKETRIKEAQEKIKSWEEQESTQIQLIKGDIGNKEEDLKRLRDNLVSPEPINFDVLKNGVKKKLSIIEDLKLEIGKLDSEINFKNQSIQDLGNKKLQAESLDPNSKCLTCHQTIDKNNVDKHIHSIVVQIENLDREKKILQAKKTPIVESTKKKADLEKELRDIEAKEFEHNHKLKQLEETKVRISNLEREISSLKDSLNNRPTCPYSSLVESIQQEQNPYISKINSLLEEKCPYDSQIDSAMKETNPYHAQLGNYKEKFKECVEIIESIDSDAARVQYQIEQCKWWKDAFHIYIKSYLTDSFLEEINKLANDTLSQMFDGILSIHISAVQEGKKQNKEKITVKIYNKNEECSYNSLSGGERCRICFALNLAISKITNINIGFLMFDEVLNGLDDVGKNQVMRVFKELESQYETVFVIDHTTEFKSLFTNNIMIRKSNGVSRVVE